MTLRPQRRFLCGFGEDTFRVSGFEFQVRWLITNAATPSAVTPAWAATARTVGCHSGHPASREQHDATRESGGSKQIREVSVMRQLLVPAHRRRPSPTPIVRVNVGSVDAGSELSVDSVRDVRADAFARFNAQPMLTARRFDACSSSIHNAHSTMLNPLSTTHYPQPRALNPHLDPESASAGGPA